MSAQNARDDVHKPEEPQDPQTITVSRPLYEQLRLWKAERSAKTGQALDWEGFFHQLLEREARGRDLLGWLYTLGVFLAVSVALGWLFGFWSEAGGLVVWIFYLLLAVGVAVFSAYLLTPWTLRQLKDFVDAPTQLREALSTLAERAGLRREVTLKIMESPEINAMTYSGPGRDYVCVTRGLVEAWQVGKLDLSELKAILAHEVGHIRHLDSLRASLLLSWTSLLNAGGAVYFWIGRISGGIAQFFAEMGSIWGLILSMMALIAVLIGYAAQILAKLASIPGFHLMRQQEYAADLVAARLVSPQSIGSALDKIHRLNEELVEKELASLPYADRWQLQPVNPTWIDRLFDTHPPIERRASMLQAMAKHF